MEPIRGKLADGREFDAHMDRAYAQVYRVRDGMPLSVCPVDSIDLAIASLRAVKRAMRVTVGWRVKIRRLDDSGWAYESKHSAHTLTTTLGPTPATFTSRARAVKHAKDWHRHGWTARIVRITRKARKGE